MAVDIWGIVKKVGSAVIRDVVPGGGLIVEAINALLPDDKRLPEKATGEDLRRTIESLPPEQRAMLEAKKFDIELTEIKEGNETLRTMLMADSTSQQTTRPKIALGAFRIVAFAAVATVSIWSIAVLQGDAKMVQAVEQGWPFILAVLTPFCTLLYAYFGVLRREHQQRMAAATGNPPFSGLAAILGALRAK